MDSGFSLDISDGDLKMAMYWADNVYNIPNWSSRVSLQNNTPTNTAMRAPGVVHSIHNGARVTQYFKSFGIDPVKVGKRIFTRLGI